MPIYAYRCAACGAEKDVLQKFSDAPLSVCPVCAAESFHRVLTAPAFQLKGSGWYVTDFRDGKKPKQADAASGNGDAASKSDAGSASKSDSGSVSKPDGAKAGAPAKAAESPSAPSGGAASGSGAD